MMTLLILLVVVIVGMTFALLFASARQIRKDADNGDLFL